MYCGLCYYHYLWSGVLFTVVTVVTSILLLCCRSSRESGDDNRESGCGRHPPERRESGRFPSAARLLRSLGRSRDDDGGGGDGARAKSSRDTSQTRLSRSNPNYHSEGKGLKKKNNWTSERELNNSVSPSTHKERSHSFCEKTNSKRRYSSSSHDNKALREETKARLQQRQEQLSPHPETPTLSPSSTATDLPPPSPLTPTSSPTSSTSPESTSENIYENLPAHTEKTEALANGGENVAVGGSGDDSSVTEPGASRLLERGERERRSVRKLTKDSGYETSPYSEGDYANIELYSDSAATAGDGDDVTLAPEAELAAPSPVPAAAGANSASQLDSTSQVTDTVHHLASSNLR